MPFISVCIPVYRTESVLARCLQSVIQQDYSYYEIVVVSDASDGKDSKGLSAKKIVKKIQKQTKIPITFIEHNKNMGILETRRSLCYYAKGEYITYVDSDDELALGALTAFAQTAKEGNYDIIHGTTISGVLDSSNKFTPTPENFYSNILYETLTGKDVFIKTFEESKIIFVLWGKLIKKNVLQKVFESIPCIECTMGEDYLLFFLISYYAKSYIGIKALVYKYYYNSGVTAGSIITNIEKWKMVCSSASCFSAISLWIQENRSNITDKQIQKVRLQSKIYLKKH